MYTEIKKFGVYGLYGYKNVEIVFNDKNTIVIAENGTGKTTLINALKATLKGEIDDLRKIKCNYVEIEFPDAKYQIRISELNFSDFLNECKIDNRLEKAFSVLKRIEIEDMLSYILSGSIEKSREKKWYKNIYTKTHFNHADLTDIMRITKRDLKNFYATKNILSDIEQSASEILEKIKLRMEDVEVIYLPTYRRIEKSTLRDEFGLEEENRYSIQDGEVVSVREYKSKANIEFGLFDVERKLKEISSSIERTSSLGYRTLSASMIEDMMTGKAKPSSKMQVPTIDELSRFLSRVVSKDKDKNKKIVDEVTGIMKDESKLKQNSILGYFLSKLKNVIDSTKELESKIESFVSICNKYLQLSDDSKSLTYDIETLQVVVRDIYTNQNIELEDLSSGEKQIISIMAHLYLDHTKEKIVLIDEPELSLSIEWQEHVLVDIVNSPSLKQMLAITHSPFIFNNILKSDVKKLNIDKI